MSLENKVVIITGGSGGIGRELVRIFLSKRAIVLYTYREKPIDMETLQYWEKEYSTNAEGHRVDITKQEQMKAFIHEVIQKQKRIDVLVNNAGIRKDKSLLYMNREEWEEVVQTNLTGAFYATQAAIPYLLKQRRGRLIQIASVSGINGLAGQVNYASSKAGIIGFTKALAKEVASYGISVNAVAPGPVRTRMLDGLSAQHIDRLLANVPIGRVCDPEEVARMVYLLADEELAPAYLTGQVIALDGGMGL